MSFFGTDSYGVDARNNLSNYGNQAFQNGQQLYSNGAGNQNNAAAQYFGLYSNQPDPSQIQQWGQQLLPQVQGTVNQIDQNRQALMNAYGNVESPNDVGNDLNAANNGWADTAGQVVGANMGNVQNAYDQRAQIQAGNRADLTNQNNQTYGDLEGTGTNVYSDLQGKNANLTSGLRGTAGTTYGGLEQGADSLASTQKSRIGTEADFANGTSARAFSPMMASTMRSLRASGIDPNSPAGQEQVRKVQQMQAHEYDGNQANVQSQLNQADANAYNAKSNLSQNQLQNDQGLAEAGATTDRGLATANLQNNQNLEQSKLNNNLGFTNQYNEEQNQDQLGNLAQQQGIGQQMLNNATTYFGNQAQNTLTQNGLQTQRANEQVGLLNGDNANANNELNLYAQQLNAGQGYGQQVWNNQYQATNGTANVANSQMQGALGYNGQAVGVNQNLYAGANANANWGTKLLAGLAGGALNSWAGGA